MQDIASLWANVEDRKRYQAAASLFRIPYWDWAASPLAGESVLPRSIGGDAFIDVSGPNGDQRIANPLYSYEFRPLDGSDFLDIAPVSLPTSPHPSPLTYLPVGRLALHRPRTHNKQHIRPIQQHLGRARPPL